MKAIQEITEWDTEYSVPNHVYFVNDSQDKMFAYVPEGSVKVQEFVKPIKFSVSRRRFQEVANVWGFTLEEDSQSAGKQYQVPGSKGAIYTVTNDRGAWTCTCSGFKFRGQCRHVESLKSPASLCG